MSAGRRIEGADGVRQLAESRQCHIDGCSRKLSGDVRVRFYDVFKWPYFRTFCRGRIEVERTLLIVKPDAVASGKTGAILARVEDEGFESIALEKRLLSKTEARSFYAIHEDKPFYESLVEFMTSGPVIVCALQRENAISKMRAIVGATDPEKAENGTIRYLYGSNVQNNAVHASDSVDNSATEIAFFFPECKLIG